ncbi:MAG: CheD, partial [Bacillota bacterium]|nr:CheD [Bacillota bacterium]
MEYIVKMGEYAVTNGEEDIIRTFALASCVAVTVYSPAKKAAGMIHVVLPSPFDESDEADRPGYFAETGIPLLIDAMYRTYGCKREELQIQMYGGAESMTGTEVYFVGKKNINAADRK